MKLNILENTVSLYYDTIKTNFKIACGKNNIKFDDDLFNDTYLKCFYALDNKDISEENAIRYFWVAYSNNEKKKYRTSKYTPKINELDEKIVYDADIENNEDRYIIFDILVNSVTKKFGEEITNAWLLHFTDNKTYDELKNMGYKTLNFHNVFRRINAYIKKTLPKENSMFKEMFSIFTT